MSIEDIDNMTTALADRAVSRRRALQLAAASALGSALEILYHHGDQVC